MGGAYLCLNQLQAYFHLYCRALWGDITRSCIISCHILSFFKTNVTILKINAQPKQSNIILPIPSLYNLLTLFDLRRCNFQFLNPILYESQSSKESILEQFNSSAIFKVSGCQAINRREWAKGPSPTQNTTSLNNCIVWHNRSWYNTPIHNLFF